MFDYGKRRLGVSFPSTGATIQWIIFHSVNITRRLSYRRCLPLAFWKRSRTPLNARQCRFQTRETLKVEEGKEREV